VGRAVVRPVPVDAEILVVVTVEIPLAVVVAPFEGEITRDTVFLT
jgi:hypothetical protein